MYPRLRDVNVGVLEGLFRIVLSVRSAHIVAVLLFTTGIGSLSEQLLRKNVMSKKRMRLGFIEEDQTSVKNSLTIYHIQEITLVHLKFPQLYE
jgi:hypothetical protein